MSAITRRLTWNAPEQARLTFITGVSKFSNSACFPACLICGYTEADLEPWQSPGRPGRGHLYNGYSWA